jgi:hypothetical protein
MEGVAATETEKEKDQEEQMTHARARPIRRSERHSFRGMEAVMTLQQLAARLSALEAEVAQLKAKVGAADQRPWWEKIVGTFEGDPYYEEAMRLGRKYRESLRPKSKKKKGK